MLRVFAVIISNKTTETILIHIVFLASWKDCYNVQQEVKLFLEPTPMWSVLQRDSEEEEFAVPEGWEVVKVNEDNFPQYASQV